MLKSHTQRYSTAARPVSPTRSQPHKRYRPGAPSQAIIRRAAFSFPSGDGTDGIGCRHARFPPQEIQVEKGHGRIETRKVQTSTALNDYLDFPYVRQVFRIERWVTMVKSGKRRHEVAFGVTSCSLDQADPVRIGELARGQWEIENGLHWERDVVFDEDRFQTRTGHGPQAMAGLRNFAISCLRLAGWGNIAKAIRRFASDWRYSLAILGI